MGPTECCKSNPELLPSCILSISKDSNGNASIITGLHLRFSAMYDWALGLMSKEESRVEREGRNMCFNDQGRYRRGGKQAKARPPGEEGMAVMGGGV